MKSVVVALVAFSFLMGCSKESNNQSNCVTSNLVAKSSAINILPNELLILSPQAKSSESLVEQLALAAPQIKVLNKYDAAFVGLSVVGGILELELLKRLFPSWKVEKVQTIGIGQACDEGEIDLNESVIPWGVGRIGFGVASSKRAWVCDTGIDIDHPDLNVNEDLSRDFVGSGGLIGLPIGILANDVNGHGTHVAGTIGAINNNFGVVGVAAGCELVAAKVLADDGNGNTGDLSRALDYIALNGSAGDVINLSLGALGSSTTVEQAIRNMGNMGFLFAISAGNDSNDAGNYTPAKVNGNNIYTVSAFKQGDVYATFSNFGNPPIDFASPGVDVLSTLPNGKYGYKSGTSMAAPHMAGLLLITNGKPGEEGTVRQDPDGNPDPIAVYNTVDL